jgi:hypothetical protein
MPLVSLAVLALLLPLPAADDAALESENQELKAKVRRLERKVEDREAELSEVGQQLSRLSADVIEVRDKLVTPAAVFMTGPPPSSDTVGVAKTVVFAPRLEVDSGKRRDIVFLKVTRVEPARLQTVAEVELGNDGAVVLPLDQNGALYVVDWSTSEGHTYDLTLRDGASGQAVATVQVRPLSASGRFVFVGYRFD